MTDTHINNDQFAFAYLVCRRSAGLDFSFVNLAQSALSAAIRPDTRMLWIETPTNPMLRLVDFEAVNCDQP